MIKIFSYSHSVKNNKIYKFIYYELLLIICFAFAYWLSDKLYLFAPGLMKNLGLGEIKKTDDFYSYLYFSLITQTTVGFGGRLPDGGHVISTSSIILKILLTLQLFSIILVTGWTLA